MTFIGFPKIYIWAPSLTRIILLQVSTTITLNDCNMITSEENQFWFNPIAPTTQTGSTTVLKVAFSNEGTLSMNEYCIVLRGIACNYMLVCKCNMNIEAHLLETLVLCMCKTTMA